VNRAIRIAAVVLTMAGPAAALAQGRPVAAVADLPAPDAFPVRAEVVAQAADPASRVVWAGALLYVNPEFEVLTRTERHGPAVFDPSSNAWYAPANGALVRLEAERAVVVLDGVQGLDFDVRAARGVAVSREPDHAIVLWNLADRSRRVLLRGTNYFAPRLSPDGSRVLVHESRPDGGHLLLIDPDGDVRDLGPGVDGTFTPDGRSVVFARVEHDRERVIRADLYRLDIVSRRTERLTATPDVAETAPAVSPDGRFVAYLDAFDARVCVAPMPGRRER